MKIFLRIVSGLLLSLALILGAGAVFLLTTYPRVPAASVSRIQPTPEKVKRGHYLANYVAVCVDCHSTRDWNQFAGPIVPGTDGKGGEQFDESMGLPGKLFAKNITPSHLATWSDGEIIRAFTSGLSRDGRALFPLMPYPNYSLMSQEDAEAIVAYLRTLKPIENTPPETHLDFPVSLLVRTMPQAAPFSRRPSPQEGLVYGKYMT
ncbi:MAG: c-type cytochrome, partial [Bdellovibrionota bacterium]